MPASYAAAGAASAVIGGVVGNIMSAGDRAEQRKRMKMALAELKKVGLPPDLSAPLLLRELKQQGVYTPELEQDLSDSFAEVKLIEEDQTIKEAQRQALTMMQRRGKVGLSAEDRAALGEITRDVQRESQAKTQQVLQSMQARGMGGAGAELQALLQSGQSEADRASQASMSVMGQAQQRALEALNRSAEMASGIRSQDYNVNATNAAAVNERNRFLAQNAIERQRGNVGMMNEADRMRLAEQQRIADYNAQLANAEQARQRQEQGQYYDRRLQYGQTMANAQLGQATAAQQRAAQTGQMWTGIGGAVGAGLSAYGQSQRDQQLQSMYGAANGLVQDPSTGMWTRPDAAGGITKQSTSYLTSPDYFKKK
jgi:hypothetical protein